MSRCIAQQRILGSFNRAESSKPMEGGGQEIQQPAIRVTNLTKVYKIYSRPIDLILELLTGKSRHQKYTALQDISFNIWRGEVVGILGRNGAGKSTLLKILAGTLDPSAGIVEINGKISAILELGTGFHPERSGRDNIYMGGMCLGMTREEIDEKIDSIIDFSELGHVIDQPFKTYSSGMQARLTFSTAIAVDPDIFIVDEALATGDMLFQEKCLCKLRSICTSGATVLLVTHSLFHIYEVCNRCILLHQSRLLDIGDPRRVGGVYERLLWQERLNQQAARLANESLRNTNPSKLVAVKSSPTPSLSNPEEAEVVAVELLDATGQNVTLLTIGLSYTVRVIVRFYKDIDIPNVGFNIQKNTGLTLTGDTTYQNGIHIPGQAGNVVYVNFTFICRLVSGNYYLGGGVTQILDGGDFRTLHVLRGVQEFVVGGKQLNGLFDPVSEITISCERGPRE